MAKYRTTKKAVYSRFGSDVYYINTGNASYLLGQPEAYTTRIEGWAADIYILHDIAIIEGDAPFGKKLDYDKVMAIWEKAYKVHRNKWTYNRQQAQIRKYADELYKLATGRNKNVIC